jgi:tetratricopeptide (TPR) repeat protein
VAEAGRAAAEGLQAPVDKLLAAFWSKMFDTGLDRESKGGGSVVTLASLRAAPYLLRQQEWDGAASLLEHVLERDTSSATVAAVLPMLNRIAEATKDTDQELGAARVLACALKAAGRRDEAESRMREILARATECGQYRLASCVGGNLIDLLRVAGRAEEALDLVETKKEATHRAGLGPWTQLIDDGHRLQLLAILGQYDEVLAEVEALRPRMDALPSIVTREEVVYPWTVRETVLDAGRLAALRLKRWEQALALNAEVIASIKARRATALDMALVLYSDYGPLLGLRRFNEVRDLLMACRKVFESERHLKGLGEVFGALADLEDTLDHHDLALRYEQTALRYAYEVGEPGDCAACHFNMANYLMRGGGPPPESLAHRLASALIRYQSAEGRLRQTLQALSHHIDSFAPSKPPLPSDFATLCSIVDRVEGVDFGTLFERLPTTHAATGDDALRQVLELVRKLPIIALLDQLESVAEAGQDTEPIWHAFRAEVVQNNPGKEADIDAYITTLRDWLTRAADADAEPVPPPPST